MLCVVLRTISCLRTVAGAKFFHIDRSSVVFSKMAMETKSEGDKLATCSACNLLFRSWAYLGLEIPRRRSVRPLGRKELQERKIGQIDTNRMINDRIYLYLISL